MLVLELIVAVLAASLLGLVVGSRWGGRRARLALQETVDQSRTALSLSMRATASTLAEAREHRDRADRYFRSIQTIEADRTQWQRLYHQQSRAHSVAQGIMLAEIHRLAMRLARHETGKKSDVNPVLQDVYDDFRSQYVDPGTAHAQLAPAPPLDGEAQQKTD